jgi:hypothetical protein
VKCCVFCFKYGLNSYIVISDSQRVVHEPRGVREIFQEVRLKISAVTYFSVLTSDKTINDLVSFATVCFRTIYFNSLFVDSQITTDIYLETMDAETVGYKGLSCHPQTLASPCRYLPRRLGSFGLVHVLLST